MKKYQIEVENRPDCCEVGAFGLHFAYGKAETDSDRAAAWFREHKGYKVTEQKLTEPEPSEPTEPEPTEAAKKKK